MVSRETFSGDRVLLMNTNKIHLIGRLSRVSRLSSLCLGGLATAGLIWLASPNVARADDSTNAPAKIVASSQASTKPDKKSDVKPAKKVSGVELYAIHCNRCHAERYPVEFNEAQWKTLMLHMRVRANLPADQAREILKYLEDEAGY